MPPTTGGSTNGSSTRDRASRRPGNVARANTKAIGVPNTTHSTVLAVEVFRLNHRAATADSEVMSSQNDDHWTRASIATSGSTMNTPPRTAGMKIHRGSPDPVPAQPGARRVGTASALFIQSVTGRAIAGGGMSRRRLETGRGQHLLAFRPGDQIDKFRRQSGLGGGGEGGDRVDIHHGGRLWERHLGDLVAGVLRIRD